MVDQRANRTVDPVFEWFNSVTASTPEPQPKAGLATSRDSPPGLGVVPGPFDLLASQPRPSDGLNVDSGFGLPGNLRNVRGAGTGMRQAGLPRSTRKVHIQELAGSDQLRFSQPPRLIGSTEQGFLRESRNMALGPLGVSPAPCLLDASPPQGVSCAYGPPPETRVGVTA